MAKTADVIQAIWGDPWFLALSVDAKCLYLWGITNDHGNLAGLYTVAAPMIHLETGLTPTRFTGALGELAGKLYYRIDSGAVWVCGRAKRVRSKTPQIAKSIARAVQECPEDDFRNAFLQKYGQEAWLETVFSDLALSVDSTEPHGNLTEVASQSHSHSQQSVASSSVVVKEQPRAGGDCERVFDAWVESKGSAGRAPVLNPDRRKLINGWLKVYPVEDLVAAVCGWRHSPHHRGENDSGQKYNSLKLCLRDPDRIEEFRDLELSPKVDRPQRPPKSTGSPGMDNAFRLAERAERRKAERSAAA